MPSRGEEEVIDSHDKENAGCCGCLNLLVINDYLKKKRKRDTEKSMFFNRINGKCQLNLSGEGK